MSVDAIGGGGGLEISGLPDCSDLSSLVLTPVGATGVEFSGGQGGSGDVLASVIDFEAAMLAAAGLCEEVLAEVVNHSLVEQDSFESASKTSDEDNVSLPDSVPSDLVPDSPLGLLHPALFELIQNATPERLLEISSNLEAGIGLTIERPRDSVGCSPLQKDSSESTFFSVGNSVVGAANEFSMGAPNEESGAFDTAFGRVARVVGVESDVVPRLSPEMLAALRREASISGPVAQPTGDGNRAAASEVLAFQKLAARMLPATSPVEGKRVEALSLPVGQASSRNENAVGDLNSSISGEGDLAEIGSSSLGINQSRAPIIEKVVPQGPALQRTPTGLAVGMLKSPSSMAVASSPLEADLRQGAGGGVDSGLFESGGTVFPSSGDSVVAAADRATGELKLGKEAVVRAELSGNRDGVSESPLRQVGGAESGADSGEATGKDSEKGGGQKAPSGEVPTIGWHGRKVVSESFALRTAGLGVAVKESAGLSESSTKEGDALRGSAAEMTAFGLVQRSGVARSFASGDVQGADRALSLERAAGEVWSRIADAVARVRAERGVLKVEIDLPRGLSVEVELRGVAGGVNAVFRVGDSGLRQTLESMWSVLPRNEKVSALDLSDVSFERESSRGFADSDSRGTRQDNQRGGQQRFDGDIQDFNGKSSEKNRRLGTREATFGTESRFSSGGSVNRPSDG